MRLAKLFEIDVTLTNVGSVSVCVHVWCVCVRDEWVHVWVCTVFYLYIRSYLTWMSNSQAFGSQYIVSWLAHSLGYRSTDGSIDRHNLCQIARPFQNRRQIVKRLFTMTLACVFRMFRKPPLLSRQ